MTTTIKKAQIKKNNILLRKKTVHSPQFSLIPHSFAYFKKHDHVEHTKRFISNMKPIFSIGLAVVGRKPQAAGMD